MPTRYISQLREEYDDSDCVWFLVDIQYRILAYNKKAAQNCVTFHNKEIAAGQSILDYARDTKNKIDSKFIECFGMAASGRQVEHKERIAYNSASINARSNFTPIVQDKVLKAVSITVEYTVN